MRRFGFLAAALAATMAVTVSVPAQAEYPERPVEFVVPWPPGDLEDVLTRMIAEDFQAEYGQPAAVVNRPGGGGGPFPGAVEVAEAPADGHTIGSFVISVPIVGPKLGIPQLEPNPFVPVGIFLTYPFVIVTSAHAPYSTMEELAEHAQDNNVVLGHFGSVLPPTRATLALASNMGFAYHSDTAFDALDCNTLASGDVDVMNTTLQLVLPCLDDVRVLASITGEPLELVSGVPTIGELDSTLDISLWNGLFVHKNVPQEARDKIAAVARRTIESERAREFANQTGAQIYWMDEAESVARIEADTRTISSIEEILGE